MTQDQSNERQNVYRILRTHFHPLDLKTKEALQELEQILSWEQLVRVCEIQKRTRGW